MGRGLEEGEGSLKGNGNEDTSWHEVVENVQIFPLTGFIWILFLKPSCLRRGKIPTDVGREESIHTATLSPPE